jgi:hypothetical protein
VQEYHIQHHFLFIEYSAEYCLNMERSGNFASISAHAPLSAAKATANLFYEHA